MDGVLDLAVVGAGMAGLAVAGRLAQRRPEWAVAVLERSGRVGGRLLSVPLPGADRPAELGGMRFRTSQPLVAALVAGGGLAERPFRTVHPDNRYLLRGARWRAGDPHNAACAYGLAGEERGCAPAELLVAAFERIVPGALGLSDDDWRAVRRDHLFQGRPLRDWSLHDALAAVLSPEAHRYVVDGFGYATVLGDRNAADAIPWVLIEARPEEENRTLVDGMEELPRALAARLTALGGRIERDREVVGVEAEPGPGGELFRLRVARGADVVARRLVLAVPPRALRRLAARTPLLGSAAVRGLLDAVTGQPASKLFLTYDRPWWRDDGGQALRVVSDLPLSKTYYFDRPSGGGGALLLASYADGPSRAFWAGLADGAARPPDGTGTPAPNRWCSYAASAAQVAEATHQLAALHRVDRVPEPRAAVFVDWGADPFGGAWHMWNPGLRSEDVMAAVAQPVSGRALYVCGEAWSRSQGWIEGALESAERIALRIR